MFSKDYVNTEGALSHLREQQRYVIGVVSGQDLFYSTERYDNGTGRPSFTKPPWTPEPTTSRPRHAAKCVRRVLTATSATPCRTGRRKPADVGTA